MSEAGKVSLPTPERKEEIKKRADVYIMSPSAHVIELLAALEEAQQQLTEVRHDANEFAEELAETLNKLAEAQQESEKHRKVAEAKILFTNQGNNDYVYGLQEDLIEAQQTVARQREALNWYGNIENYEVGNYTRIIDDVPDEWESRVQQDAGTIARAAVVIFK